MNCKTDCLKIIRSVLRDEELSGLICDFKELAGFASRHGVLHLVYFGMMKLPEDQRPAKEICQTLQKYAMLEILKNEKLLHEADRISQSFEQQGIYHMALKGINTKRRYSDPVIRSMGDMDFLYQAKQTDEIAKIMETLGYEGSEGRKHDCYKKGNIKAELHRELVVASSAYSKYYSDIWDRSQLKKDCKYTYEMSLEDEYIYNLVHLTEHFKDGGVGIRFIMDVYVYEHIKELDRAYVKKELDKIGLFEFYENIRVLSENWFGDAQKNAVTDRLGEYILDGALYGTMENAAALSVAKNGRIGYLMQICFPNYAEMCTMFPWLEGKKYLLPYSWALRAFRSFTKRRWNVTRQFEKTKSGDAALGKKLQSFYRDCGLS